MRSTMIGISFLRGVELYILVGQTQQYNIMTKNKICIQVELSLGLNPLQSFADKFILP